MKYEEITIGMKLKSLKIKGIEGNKILIAEIRDIAGCSYVVIGKSKTSEFRIEHSKELLQSILYRINKIMVIDSSYDIDYTNSQENCIDNLQSLLEEQLKYYK